MNSKLALCALSLLISVKLMAQSTNLSYVPTIVPKTPNAAAQEKFGNYQVNMFSGLPEITIPLYTVQSGDIKIPITLAYHAAGIRVNDLASWVGMNWFLSAGGSVTRTVLGGRADEDNGYLSEYRDPSTLHPTAPGGDIDYLYQTVVQRIHDTRPDMFSYNIPGYSGKFFFNVKDAYKIKLIPFSPISIKNTGTFPGILKFNILDEQGNLYLLGQNIRETTSTYTQSGIATSGVTRWLLERIISQNRRDTVSFSYTSQVMNTPDQVGQSVIVEDQEQHFPNCSGIGTYAGPVTTVNTNTSNSGNEQEPQVIRFKNGEVRFVLSVSGRSDIISAPKSLDSIKVFNYSYGSRKMELQKSVVFYKSYYQVGGKLRLDSVRILDKAGSIQQRYSFSYNSIPIPGPTSYARDYWGYYNGKTSNNTLIPKTQIDIQPNLLSPVTQTYIGGTDPSSRDVDTVAMQAGVLTSIRFPAGGHTDFSYQTNRYYDSGNVLRFAGGLRIASISSYDSPSGGTPVIRTYVYNKARPNFLTSGFTGIINYGFFVHNSIARWYAGCDAGQKSAQKRVRSFLSEPSYNLTPADGSPIVYPIVTEYIGTPFNNAGKTVYTFRDKANEISGTTAITQTPTELDYSFARGQILRKKDYINQAGQYFPVKEETSTYTAFPLTTYADVGWIVGQQKQTEGSKTVAEVNQVTDNDSDTYPFTAFSIVSDDNYITSKTVRYYDNLDTARSGFSITEFKYDNIAHQQVTRTRHTDAKGLTTVSLSRYPSDYIVGTKANHAALDTMISRNMQAAVVEKWDSVKNAATGVNGVSRAQLNAYFISQGVGNAVVMATVKKLPIGAPVSNFVPASVSGGALSSDPRYVQMISFDQYDAKNNLVKYTPRGSRPVMVIWDYQQSLPVAMIQNASVSAYTGFEADGSNSFSTTNNWYYDRSQTAYDVTAPSGVRSYKLSSGAITSVALDNTRSNLVSYWSNGGAATVQYNSSYASGTPVRTANGWTLYEHFLPASGGASAVTLTGTASIDELRAHPADAQMTTYTYSPDGLTDVEDAKGMVSHFEYDPYQRLRTIKDWSGNIVKSFGYHSYDMTVGSDAMTGTFTRNNCPPGTSPQSTSFSVAANAYFSSTKASANADAAYELKVYGQMKANNPAICGCPIPTIAFTLSNTTGLNGYQATFSGPSTLYFNVPSSGTLTVQVPVGSYTVSVNPVGSFVKTYKLGNRTPVSGHGATFSGVSIATGSTDNSLSIY